MFFFSHLIRNYQLLTFLGRDVFELMEMFWYLCTSLRTLTFWYCSLAPPPVPGCRKEVLSGPPPSDDWPMGGPGPALDTHSTVSTASLGVENGKLGGWKHTFLADNCRLKPTAEHILGQYTFQVFFFFYKKNLWHTFCLPPGKLSLRQCCLLPGLCEASITLGVKTLSQDTSPVLHASVNAPLSTYSQARMAIASAAILTWPPMASLSEKGKH